MSPRLDNPRVRLLAMILPALATWAPALADAVYQSSAGKAASALKIPDVKITRIETDKLFFETAGRETSRDIKVVARIEVEGQSALNAAEEAFEKDDWPAATAAYQQVLLAPAKPWIKDWVELRLLQAASHTGNFPAAFPGYLRLIQKDPAMAARYKPPLPEPTSPHLDAALAEAQKLLANPRLTDDQKRALYSFQAEIYRHKGDGRNAAVVAEKMSALPGATTEAQAQVKLELAKIALADKDYKKTANLIQSSRTLFTDPIQQADALYLLAEAQYGLAKDEAALKDAALAYMRVVAHFANAEGKPHVADSLFMTAKIHEQLKEPETATRIYHRLAAEFKDDPAAAKALQRLAQLRSPSP